MKEVAIISYRTKGSDSPHFLCSYLCSMTEKKGITMDKAFAALLSEDDAKALDALAVIHEMGDANSIFPLLHALAATDEPGASAAFRPCSFK